MDAVFAAPLSTTRLFPESLSLSAKQREVLDTLNGYPNGTGAAEISTVLGVHVNTVRGHLEELEEQGLVRVSSAPSGGHGRPTLVFQVRMPDVVGVAQEYLCLIKILVEAMEPEGEITREDHARARDIGRRWAQEVPSQLGDTDGHDNAIASLLMLFRQMGPDPLKQRAPHPVEESTAGTVIQLNACPLVKAGSQPSQFICAVHEAYLRETLDEQLKGKIRLTLFPRSARASCDIVAIPCSAHQCSTGVSTSAPSASA
ncbi:helix-turn-helix domain-containing protein [Corynebacterium casei]|uniref:helix-turn-helix domain-containing protein n=1 Tax=Corynebacterium casei TaxID=160386 RepID=UPI003F8F342A